MSQSMENNNYPLPEALTRRVVMYLNGFRIFISLLLIIAFFSGIFIKAYFLENSGIAGTFLIAYFVMAVFLAMEARRPNTQHYFLAQISLFTDILFLTVLLFLFDGPNSGLAVLLIFASASGAILLTLRMALFLAALVTLAFIAEALSGLLLRGEPLADLMQAGLYGFIAFIIAVLINLLSYWVRDYRLLAEQQAVKLSRLEQINELIIRRMRSGVLAVNENCEIRLMNESAWFLLGSPSGKQKSLAEVAPELRTALEAWREKPSAEIEPLTLQSSQARIVPKFVGLPGSSDIRVLVFLEDDDVVAQRALELSANSLAKLSGSIAHEIRNPLAAVSHATQLLLEAENMPESDKRLLNIIHSHSRRMNDIVENILQLSRREKSRPDYIELNPYLKDIVDEFKSTMTASSLKLHIDSQDDDVWVLFDRSQLHQVIWKLLENALQHGAHKQRSPVVSVKVSHLPGTGYCLITVEDNGPGISQENIKHVFEPFYTTHNHGSGLGLYIARQLCEANQADLTADSSPENGTRFHIRLALARNETNNASQPIGMET